ncbi:hypothetical protein COV61_02750, partial [Candidatus Micrarchaeota archaeon CG11_big_fil_rev_8_21_14_0_20_47_5]
PIEQEITSSLDTSYYSNELNSQYSFEISNGFCPEIGCVCGDETGEVTDPDCSEYDTQILNRLPGASFMCESNAECYSRVCSNTVISTQKCVRHGGPEDGQPVDCGCETNEYGEIVCDVGETVTKMRALQPSSFGGGECGDDQTTCFACCIPWTQNLVGAYPSNFEWFNPSANNGNCYIAEQYQHRDESCDAYLIGVGCIAWSCSWGTMVPAFLSEGIPSQIAPDPTPYTGPQIRANQLTSSAGELWTDDVAYTVVDTQFVGTFNTPEFWNNVRDAVKLIDECNLIYDQSDSNRDVYAFQIPTIYPKFHQTADSHCDDHQCDIHGEDNYYPLTLSGLYKLVFKTHEDPENPGTYALGSCKTDPDDPSKLLMYHYGTCEPGSLLTSAVQEIPPQTPFPVCL